MLAAAYQARSLQRRLIDRRRRIQLAGVDRLLHGPQIGFGIILAENVIKAALRQTHVQRHLSAFKAVDADAGTRLRALLSATSSLAFARADAPPDTPAALATASIISEFVEFHVLALSFLMFEMGRASCWESVFE